MPELALKLGILFGMDGSRREVLQRETADEVLAERVRTSGDTAAFALLVTRYRGRIVALARGMLSETGPEDAEDVAQEAFVAAYHKRATFRRGEPFRPWLYRIAVNRCLDHLRARARRPETIAGTQEGAQEPAAPGSDPLHALLADEREVKLTAAVAELPPNLRAVFVLRHVDDLSYEEIAGATGLPLGTVKTHLFRARAELRQSLAGYLEP